MVLEIKGYNPAEVGLRKFLTTQETEVIGCLWDLGKGGGTPKTIQERLSAQGCRHSVATVDKALKNLKEMGVVSVKLMAKSAPKNVYYPLMGREELPGYMVGRLVSTLNQAMPEAMSRAAKKLNP